MIQEYTVEVDGKHILFVDDIDDQLDVSSFEIMMDFIGSSSTCVGGFATFFC